MNYYKHSGKFTAPGVIMSLVLGSIASAVFGVLYVCLSSFIVGLLSCLFVLVYGAFASAVTGKLLKAGRVRNRMLAIGVLLTTQTIGFYVSWSFFVLAQVDVNPTALLNPAVLWATIHKVNEVGAWSIGSGGAPVSGILLWVFWLGEAAIIYLCVLVGLSYVDGAYCEKCDRWCEPKPAVAVLEPIHPEKLRLALEQRQYERLSLSSHPADSMCDAAQLDLEQCSQCQETATVSAKLIKSTIKGGKPNRAESTVLQQLLVSKDEATALCNLHFLAKAPVEQEN